MKTIPSFTIMELVITLIISSVVISSGYYAFALVEHQFDKYRLRAAAIDKYHSFSIALRNDFDRSESVRLARDSQLIFQWSDTIVSYSILPKWIVRELPGGVADTFSMKATVKDLRYIDDSVPLIEGIRLEVDVIGEPIVLHVRKIYSAQEILYAEQRRDGQPIE